MRKSFEEGGGGGTQSSKLISKDLADAALPFTHGYEKDTHAVRLLCLNSIYFNRALIQPD